jgi:DNA-binding response OmpR family regulator
LPGICSVAERPIVDSLEVFQRILVVDDDEAVLRLVRDKLDRAGYEVFTARSGQEALDTIRRQGLPHLGIVDIHMPGMDGFEFCDIVQEYSDLPVIMLTAVDEEESIIRGIECFAEDYVTKPFSPRELVARVRRVLRRIGDFSYALQAVIPVDGRLAIDFGRQQAIVNDHPVALTPTESKLLYILMRNAGHTVTTQFLLGRVWPLSGIFEDSLRVHIHHLRRKIELDSSNPRYILTMRGVGYRMVPPGG